MKNLILMILVLFGLSSCDKEMVMADSKIPSDINSYISTYFPDNKVIQVIKDYDDLSVSYDVLLEGNIQLEFNGRKKIQSIESVNPLPDAVIPEKILEYVKLNYPENFIKKWELDDRGQEVGLDNRIELKFSKTGDFLKIDL